MKSDLHVKLVNDFSLTPDYTNELNSYYLLHWSTMYTFKKLSERKDGLIEHNNRVFVPIFKSESFPLDTNSQLMLSFRIPYENDEDLFVIPNYVLIKSAT